MRRLVNFFVLLSIKGGARLFYRFRLRWIGQVPESPWRGDYRIIAILNHTSLFEWLWAGTLPSHLLWRIASCGLIPAAEKTLRRPVVGRFFKLLAPHVIAISRESDRTWEAVLDRLDSECMVLILPEGRMKRADGLDKHGKPMTVRGGIADILQAMSGGRMLLAYSGGLHHVQVPGQLLPKVFKTIRMTFESVDIPTYKQELGADGSPDKFKLRVIQDLERRRDLYCPVGREIPQAHSPRSPSGSRLRPGAPSDPAPRHGPSRSRPG